MAEQKTVIVKLRDFFGMSSSEFMTEWKDLTEQDKDDLKKGALDGTWNY